MSYNTKDIKRTFGSPVPQYYNPDTDDWEPIYGKHNASRVLLYDTSGNPLLTEENPGNVKVINSNTEPVPTKLTGSIPTGSNVIGSVDLSTHNIPDSQAIPMTQAQKDVVARATEKIIDIIGVENISLFLPMWETEGTKAHDLLNRDLTFTINGATLGQLGPFGNCMSFDGVNDYLIQDPITQNTAGSVDAVLGTGKKLATKLEPLISATPGFVRLRLKRVGTLDNATIKVCIYQDNGDVPGVKGVETLALECSEIDTLYETRGLVFDGNINLSRKERYWVVLEYADDTGVDDSNYVYWQYENSNTYGQNRASFDGSIWTTHSGENHVFGLYKNIMPDNDCSIILSFKHGQVFDSNRHIFSSSAMKENFAPLIGDYHTTQGAYIVKAYEASGGSIRTYIYEKSLECSICVVTFSASDASKKLNTFFNGKLIATNNGTENTGLMRCAQPLTIGAYINYDGSVWTHWNGSIGPVIITNSELTAGQIGQITNQLFALRKMGVAI